MAVREEREEREEVRLITVVGTETYDPRRRNKVCTLRALGRSQAVGCPTTPGSGEMLGVGMSNGGFVVVNSQYPLLMERSPDPCGANGSLAIATVDLVIVQGVLVVAPQDLMADFRSNPPPIGTPKNEPSGGYWRLARAIVCRDARMGRDQRCAHLWGFGSVWLRHCEVGSTGLEVLGESAGRPGNAGGCGAGRGNRTLN